ncbi:MAG: hypothetical protein IPP13_08010 [Kouleothrix sp.]|jgi:tetratricopeptide (TPR) repeat protein|nr:hypothetical protein [Kouleothrix sp.]
MEVGQCKRYEHFSPTEIRTASDEFLAHWDYWQTQSVRRFVLFVTADVSSRRHIAVIDAERERFRTIGVVYEVWSSETIQAKLRNHPAIVARYLYPPAYWIEVICGVTGASPWRHLNALASSPETGSASYFADQLDVLSGHIATDIDQQIAEMRRKIRAGRSDEASARLQQLKLQQAVWDRLGASLQARLLRVEARIELHQNRNTYQATQLADQANRLVPDEPDDGLQAMLTFYASGPEAALAVVYASGTLERDNLRAAFLLELGRIEEVRAVLDQIDIQYNPTAETFRLRALLSFVTGNVEQARLAAQRALALEPEGEAVRLVAACIDYFSSIAACSCPAVLPAVPEPVDWVFVKRDDTSLARLRAAATTFGDLAELARDQAAQHRLLVWRMAALANDYDSQDDSIALCDELLRREPGDGAVISWIIARGYAIDLSSTAALLRRRVREGKASIQDVLLLSQCLINERHYKQAIRLLKDTQLLFTREHLEVLWDTWVLQVRLLNGDRKAFAEVLALPREDEQSVRLRLIALRLQAQRNGEWESLREQLEADLQATHEPGYLLELCELFARYSAWEELADRAELLANSIETPEALRLATIGLYNVGRYQACQQLLDQSHHLFQYGQLPASLRRIRAMCLLHLGVLSEAQLEAERLIQAEPNVDNILALIDIHLHRGDLIQIAAVAQRLRNHADLPVEQAFRLASLIRGVDLPLAREFWHQIVRGSVPDSLVGPVFNLGMQLGLDTELRDLSTRLMALAAQGQGGIQLFELPEFPAFAEDLQRRSAELTTYYREGSLPVHLLSELLNVSLIDLYHRALTAKERSHRGWHRQPLLVRHGSRLLAPAIAEQPSQWRLHVDITSLLLAAHVDMLDIIEQTFAPIRIPASLMPALLTIRERLFNHQPSRLDAYRRILGLLRDGRLRIIDPSTQRVAIEPDLAHEFGDDWAALHAYARANEGCLVDFLPLRKRGSLGEAGTLPNDAARYVINCRTLVESLKQYGVLSDERYHAVIDAMGTEGQAQQTTHVPPLGRVLICRGNIPEVLIDAEVLDVITSRFRVFIERDEQERANEALFFENYQQETLAWLDRLISHVRTGLDNGTYQRLPETTAEREDEREAFFSRCLTALFAFPVQEGDVIWVDDRFVNAYLHRDTAPIVGISDVLQAAFETGSLRVSRYYDILSRLRAADVRFLPVRSDEIVYALTQASVDERGGVIETEQLVQLRRYVARCLLQPDVLQWDSSPERMMAPLVREGEASFIVGLHQAIDEALRMVWQAETPVHECRARATWIVDNLLFDPLMARTAFSLPTASDQQHLLVASHFTSLIIQGWALERDNVETDDTAAVEPVRQAYREWLEHWVIAPRIESEPLLIVAVANTLKHMLIDVFDHLPEQFPAQLVAARLRILYANLPAGIRVELERDPDVMSRLGLTLRSFVPLAGLGFEPRDFWVAVERVVAGEAATITPIGRQHTLTFEPAREGEQSVFTFQHPERDGRFHVNDAALRLVTPVLAVREAILRENRQWFDCSDEDYQTAFAEIVTLPDPQQRVDAVVRWRNSNIDFYYASFEERLHTEGTFRLDDLIPSAIESLKHHFRLDWSADLPFRTSLDSAALKLHQEVGLAETIDRLARFPIALPIFIITTVQSLSFTEQRSLIKELLPLTESPLSLVHIIHILHHIAHQQQIFHRLARRLASRLVRMLDDQTVSAFQALLVWVYESFSAQTISQEIPVATRLALAWAHTDKMFRLLAGAGVSAAWLVQTFNLARTRLIHELLMPETSLWHDISHPRRQHPVSFLVAGLIYGISNDAGFTNYNSLRRQILDHVFLVMNGERYVVPELLVDPAYSPDTLGSFLGARSLVHLEHLVGSNVLQEISHDAIKAWVEGALETLQTTITSEPAWTTLQLTLGVFPSAPEVKERLRVLLRQLDLVDLFRRAPLVGTVALQVTAQQVGVLEDSTLGKHIYDQLVSVAHVLGTAEVQDEIQRHEVAGVSMEHVVLQLLGASIHVTKAAFPGQSIEGQYSVVLRGIVDMQPIAARLCRPLIQYLCRHLPIAQAQAFWSLLLRLRAE